MTTRMAGQPPEEARDRARRLVEALRDASPRALRAAGVDLGPALEQAIHVWLRDGLGDGSSLRGRLRRGVVPLLPVAAALRALVPARPDVRQGAILALVRQPVHVRLLTPIADEIARRAGPPFEIVRVADAHRGPGHRLDRFLDRAAVRDLLRADLPEGAEIRSAWQRAAVPIDVDLAEAVRRELRLLRIAAVGLARAIDRIEPPLVVTYDEVGRWGRLLAETARTAGVPSVDLPHAEAVDTVAMRGIGYDTIAVFGAAAAARVRAAGVDPGRIVEIGSPSLDALLSRAATTSRGVEARRRIVFASQYLGGVVTAEVKARAVAAAIDGAAPLAPAEVVLVPHPVERDGVLAETTGRTPAPPGVEVRTGERGSLHDELLGAWALVTGSSQSVIEATAIGVPAITVNTTGGPDPVTYAADGIALGTEDAAGVRRALESLLDEPYRRRRITEARSALEARIGPLDGRSTERAADLLLSMAGGGSAARMARGTAADAGSDTPHAGAAS